MSHEHPVGQHFLEGLGMGAATGFVVGELLPAWLSLVGTNPDIQEAGIPLAIVLGIVGGVIGIVKAYAKKPNDALFDDALEYYGDKLDSQRRVLQQNLH